MKLYEMMKTDEAAEREGVWYPFAKNDDGTVVAFRLALMGNANKSWVKSMEKRTQPVRKELKNGLLSDDKANELMLETFLDAVLLDWRNVYDRDDKPLKFSRDNARKLLTDIPRLFDRLQEEAKNLANFLESNLESDLGNSGVSLPLDSSKDPLSNS